MSQPTPQMLGDGAAANAAKKLGSRAYQLHVAEATATGDEPMSEEDFNASRKPAESDPNRSKPNTLTMR